MGCLSTHCTTFSFALDVVELAGAGGLTALSPITGATGLVTTGGAVPVIDRSTITMTAIIETTTPA
ncbi:hypothetical protein ACSTG9_23320, partial [Vibrio parahaemolyticus]